MKQTEMIALGLAGVALYLIVKSNKGTSTGSAASGLRDMSKTVTEILESTGKAFANGWRYFTDGTAIDPAGNYYQGGQLIWSNPEAGRYV